MGRTIDTQNSLLTQDKIKAAAVDGILSGNLIADFFLSNGKPWGNGSSYKVDVQTSKPSNMGSYTGMGTFDTDYESNLIQLSFTPASMYASATVPYFELAINKSNPVINLEALQMDKAKNAMIDLIGDKMYGSGAGSDPDGLANIIDDGSVASTYGGQSRETYSTALNSNVSTAVGSIGIDTFLASIDAATFGTKRPNLIITTQTLYRALEDLFFSSAMATYGIDGAKRSMINRLGEISPGAMLEGRAGYGAIYVRGIPIVADQKCTSGYIYYINKNELFWTGLPHAKHGMVNLGTSTIEGVGNPVPSNHGIAWTGWKEPINSDGETGQFLLSGQMITNAPKFHAVDQGCTA